jgi:hypothetical protein
MATARTIIRRAMQKAGILSKTEQPSSDEANDALDTLNDLLSSVGNENLMIYARLTESFTLTANQASYTIGTGGNFNTTRPLAIASGFVRIGGLDYPLYPLRDTSYDENVNIKALSNIPERYVYDNAFPLGTLTLYPVPSSAWQIFLRMEKPLTQFTLDDDVALPPGWSQFLIYQLAVLLAPEYGVPLDPKIEEIARMSKATIELQVARNRSMDTQPIGAEPFNIYTGIGY